VMIAGLRGLGLPGRYVSAILRPSRRPETAADGADATHAWSRPGCGA